MPVLEQLEPRDVLIGRTTHVRRTLPHKGHRMVGAWCFLDHFGPDDIKQTGGMWVPPHPHTGLQTVTWLFEGLARHTDSLGSDQLIRPGQLNVMTAGAGICHAEASPDDAPATLHGIQLWVALPEASRDTAPADFVHLADLPRLESGGAVVTVFMGSLAGRTSAAPTFTPVVGAEVRLAAGGEVTLPVEAEFEHAVLVVDGEVEVDGSTVARHRLAYLGAGADVLRLRSAREATVVLLGGRPFEEEIVMWWNFIGRSHEEIVQQRDQWNAGGVESVPERFGQVSGFPEPRLLAPPMPNTRLRPRGR